MDVGLSELYEVLDVVDIDESEESVEDLFHGVLLSSFGFEKLLVADCDSDIVRHEVCEVFFF